MTNHEEWQERYEDALFALLAEDAKQVHNEQSSALYERLEQSDEIQIPLETDERMHAFIYSYHPVRRFNKKRFAKTASRVAVAACLTVSLTATAFAASPTLRNHVLNLLITTTEQSTDFTFSYDEQTSVLMDYATGEVQDFIIGWLPDEFIFEKEERYSDQIIYSFYTTDEKYLSIEKITNTGTTFGIDTEDCQISYVPIRGQSALVSEKENDVILTWAEPDNATFYCVTGEGVEKQDIVKIAQNIQEQ